MEKVNGDSGRADLANAVAEAMDKAMRESGVEPDIAACIVVQVAADYARVEYGRPYLKRLAGVVVERGKMPLPKIVLDGEPEGAKAGRA